MVSTLDSESSDPSTNLGGTFNFLAWLFLFFGFVVSKKELNKQFPVSRYKDKIGQ